MSTLIANEPSDLAFDEVKAADLVIMSGDEAAQVDLVSLISKRDWQHVIDRLKDSPHEARRKHVMTLDGIETTCYPLHLSVSKKPPVSCGEFWIPFEVVSQRIVIHCTLTSFLAFLYFGLFLFPLVACC